MRRRMWHGLLAVAVLGLFYGEGAWAANQWYTCTIDSVGTRQVKVGTTYQSQPVVQLDQVGGGFTDTEFRFHYPLKGEMLAMALAAQANGFQVEILANLATTTTPYVILQMHVLAPAAAPL